MTLLQTNATISTTALVRATNQTVTKLTNAPAFIDSPSAQEISQYSGMGIIRYVVLVDPGTDIVPGDTLFIQSWGQNVVNPAQPFRVFSADPEGGLGLEDIACVVGKANER